MKLKTTTIIYVSYPTNNVLKMNNDIQGNLKKMSLRLRRLGWWWNVEETAAPVPVRGTACKAVVDNDDFHQHAKGDLCWASINIDSSNIKGSLRNSHYMVVSFVRHGGNRRVFLLVSQYFILPGCLTKKAGREAVYPGLGSHIEGMDETKHQNY